MDDAEKSAVELEREQREERYQQQSEMDSLRFQIALLSQQLESRNQIDAARKEAQYEEASRTQATVSLIERDRAFVFGLIERLVPTRLDLSTLIAGLGKVAEAYTRYAQESRQDEEDLERETSSTTDNKDLFEYTIEWIARMPPEERLTYLNGLPDGLRARAVELLHDYQGTPEEPVE